MRLGKGKVLHLGQLNRKHKHRLGVEMDGAALREKHLEVLGDKKLLMTWLQCVLEPRIPPCAVLHPQSRGLELDGL